MSFEGHKQSSGDIRASYGEVEGSLRPGEKMLVIHGYNFLSYPGFIQCHLDVKSFIWGWQQI